MHADHRPDRDVVRASFDATLDECVDASMRMLAANPVVRRQQLRSYVLTLAVLVATGLVTFGSRRTASVEQWALVAAMLVAFAAALLPVFVGVTRWRVRARVRELLVEKLGGRSVVRSDFEVRDDGLWSGSPVGDVQLPWALATRFVAGDDVEVWFDSTPAIVRARAFESPAHKAAFEAAVTSRLPAGAVRG